MDDSSRRPGLSDFSPGVPAASGLNRYYKARGHELDGSTYALVSGVRFSVAGGGAIRALPY
jgi:hypothetical protein